MKLLLALVAALLCACTTVPMTDAEQIACRNDPCAAFTEQDILQILGKGFKDGYEQGWKDAMKQRGWKL